MVFKCQRNEVHSLTLQYFNLNQPNKSLIFTKEKHEWWANVEDLSFDKFELPHFRGKTIVVVGMHLTLTNDDLLVESNFWWYLQLISATSPAYRSTGTCCAPKTCSSRFRRSLIPPKWMIPSPRWVLDVYTESVPPSLCLWRLLLGWIQWFHPLDLLTLHQGTEPSTSAVLHHWIVHEHRSTRPLLQIYTIWN